MAYLTRTFTFTDGTTAYGSQVDSEIANIVNTLNTSDAGTKTWTNVKVATLTLAGNAAAGGFKITGLAQGTTSGDSVSYDQLGNFLIPTGVILPYAAASPPTGWLTCDGSAVSRATYANLFGVCSTSYGAGDGSTTFNLPDLRRRVIVGIGGVGTATLANSQGATGGEEAHALQTAELASHTHTPTDAGHTHGETATTGAAGGVTKIAIAVNQATGQADYANTTDSATTGITIGNTGSGTAHNNIQPSMVMLYMIKT